MVSAGIGALGWHEPARLILVSLMLTIFVFPVVISAAGYAVIITPLLFLMRNKQELLAFICKPDDAAVVALKRAAETGEDKDIKQARTLFMRLKPGDRQAALSMISGN